MMNIEIIRRLDKYFGSLFCLLCTIAEKIRVFFRRPSGRYIPPSKILFIKLTEQGSTVLAYPAFRRAAELVGKDNIYLLVLKENREIVDIMGIFPPSNIIEIDGSSWISIITSTFRFLSAAKKERIQAVVDMEFFSRTSAVLAYLSGASYRSGLHLFGGEGPYRGDLFTHRLVFNPHLHTRALFLCLTEALRHAPPENKGPVQCAIPGFAEFLFEFFAGNGEKRALLKKIELRAGQPIGKPIVLLNPKLSDPLPARRWPRERFITLGNMLRKRFPGMISIIIGDYTERESHAAIASEIQGAISLAGHTSLRELLTLFCVSDILITSDSGPAHFASLTPISSVVLFGPETPLRFGTDKVNDRTINVRPHLTCSPCITVFNQRKPLCGDGACTASISVEEIYANAERLLSLRGRNSAP